MAKRALAASKSLLILCLAVFAVYQVTELWLVSLTNRNFFLYVGARFPAAAPDGQGAWVLPMRIASGDGSGMYSVRYSMLQESAEWEFALFALGRLFAGGELARGGGPGYMDGPHLVFDYSRPVDAGILASVAGQPRSRLPADIGFFDSFTIAIPGGSGAVEAIFRLGGEERRLSLEVGTRRNPPEDFEFGIQPVSADGLHFVRDGGGFFPVVPEGFEYYAVYPRNPFTNAFGLLHLSTIRPRIEHFFDNPATIIPGLSREVYTFSNINVMVRYLQNDVLEYTSFRPIGRRARADLLSDFAAALAFAQGDPYVTNELWLMGYDARGSEHVFMFGYVAGDFPMLMRRGWPTEPSCAEPLAAPVEVTVMHGRVVRYRRLAHSFELAGYMLELDLGEAGPGRKSHLAFPIGTGGAIVLATE